MENVKISDVIGSILDKIKSEWKNMAKLNVMIVGKTGVGKSTLINSVFNERLANVGVGRPVTTDIKYITKDGFPLGIYDTPGLELAGERSVDNIVEQVGNVIKQGIDSGDISKAIHCMWYCINAQSRRIEDTEIDVLRAFAEKAKAYNVPVIVVLTQSFNRSEANAFKSEIEKLKLNVITIVPVLAEPYFVEAFNQSIPVYGLNDLTEVMKQSIPEAVQKTFIAIQKVNLDMKITRAHEIVTAAAVACAGTAAAPIPFSDAFVLVPEQVTMLAAITVNFGINIEKGLLTTIISATIGSAGTTILGRSLVANLLKLIPGVGSVAGGVISATTAGILTTALGEAYIQIMIKICKNEMTVEELSSEKGRKKVEEMFKERLKLG